MPDSSPPNIDVAKLYDRLGDPQQQQQIGRQVLRAVIIDVLRSKADGTALFWIVRHLDGQSSVAAVLQELIDDVSLTEEERKILNELEKEEEQGQSPTGG